MNTVRHLDAKRLGFALLFITLAWPCRDLPAESSAPIELDIPAGPLATALNRLVDESALQIVYDARLTEGLQSRRLAGRYTPEAALRELLAGTELDYRVRERGTVTLERATRAAPAPQPEPLAQATPPPKKSDQGATELPEMTVTASPRDATSYNVPNATTATKTDTPIMETPLNIQVIPQQVLRDQQVVRIDKALQNVSGVTPITFGISKNFNLRGFANSAYRNGIPNRQTFVDQSFDETANLDRIEVLKGPAAILFGRIEPGGLINLVTKQPLSTPYYALEQQFGSFEFYRTTLDATGPITRDDTLAYRFNLVDRSSKCFTTWPMFVMLVPGTQAETNMARETGRAPLLLSGSHRQMLTDLSGSRTAPAREVERAKVLLRYADGVSISDIQRQVGVSRPSIYKCIDKALSAGVQVGLKDTFHSPKEPEILADAKAWVVNLACTKPKDHGLAAELWTLSALVRQVRKYAVEAGFPRLAEVGKTTVWRILNEQNLKPHRIRYYLEKRDPEFDRKMREVLLVYQEVSLHSEGMAQQREKPPVYTVSVDEKPGVQAIGLTAPDLPPIPGKEASVARDYEYVRHGTLSILAGLDLHTGEIIANVEPKHRSREFIGLLKRLDAHYPTEAVIRVVLDNHSAHISKETMAYLATRPGRFEYIHTPKHGSWLNLIECAFSKMARTFLRHIRVTSKAQLKERILKGIAEFNEAPVPFHWKKFDLDLA